MSASGKDNEPKRSGKQNKRKQDDDGEGEQPATKQQKTFAMSDFLQDDVPVFEDIINKHLLLALYHMEVSRFVQNFTKMGKKLAKAVSTQNEIISTV